ncbi:hypothetical protein IMSHALPRED_006237 [Imshaugia aleurites]|uniref:Arginase n=1 Tax=Imshaugia aleurites TaxID=172621 RepID=A0A8H3FHK4_9LECA|nr:hypothetical protein IMSHALPRED_006237 [Imshaugia aleurites]
MSNDIGKSIALIIAPYHTGIHNHRVGAGPHRILAKGLLDRLHNLGYTFTFKEIDPVDDFEGEIGRSFEVIRRIASYVSEAVKHGSFPILLAGNCNAEIGVAAAMSGIQDFEVVWFDAHSNMDSPDEATSGYFDGMGVSMLMGESWKALMATVTGHRLVSLDRAIFCGVRDLSDGQRTKLEKSSARVVYGGSASQVDFASGLGVLFDRTAKSSCLVHVDLDCLDTSIGLANEYAAPGGLGADELLDCLNVISAKRKPIALMVASFSPDLEGGDQIADVAVDAIVHLMSVIKEKS